MFQENSDTKLSSNVVENKKNGRYCLIERPTMRQSSFLIWTIYVLEYGFPVPSWVNSALPIKKQWILIFIYFTVELFQFFFEKKKTIQIVWVLFFYFCFIFIWRHINRNRVLHLFIHLFVECVFPMEIMENEIMTTLFLLGHQRWKGGLLSWSIFLF